MSSLLIADPGRQRSEAAEWARLIPGEEPELRRDAQKRPRSLLPSALDRTEKTGRVTRSPFSILVPSPVQSPTGWRWLRCLAADWALMTLNWLLLGALLVPIRMLFPRITFFEYATGAPLPLLGLAVLQAALLTLVGQTEGLYAISDLQPRILQKSVALSTGLVSLGAGFLTSRWATAGLCCMAGLLHLGALWMWRRIGTRRDHSDQQCRNVLIVGAGRVGRVIADHLRANPEKGRKFCGFLDNEEPLNREVIGTAADLARVARVAFIDEVILAAPKDSHVASQVVREARRLRLDVEIVPELFGCSPITHDIESIGAFPLICLHAERLPALGLMFKRLVDVVAGSIALLMLLPLLGVIALLIRLDSPGHVLYCAPRAGRKGRTFRCFKFRTMVSNAEELKLQLRDLNQRSGPFFKIAGDPRVTRVGAYLRRYSLDELPQLWNVLRGEMSLVGPRPHPLDDVSGYDIEHLARLDVTPGMTGLWQVTARRDGSFRHGMELDREYIRSWSLGLDLRILMRTFLAVAQGSGE